MPETHLDSALIPVPGSSALDAYAHATTRMVFDALAPNTRAAYVSALKVMNSWLRAEGHSAFTNDHLALYLSTRHASGASPATLRMAVAAVRWFYKATGHPCPIGQRTQATLKTLAWTAAAGKRRPAPMMQPSPCWRWPPIP